MSAEVKLNAGESHWRQVSNIHQQDASKSRAALPDLSYLDQFISNEVPQSFVAEPYTEKTSNPLLTSLVELDQQFCAIERSEKRTEVPRNIDEITRLYESFIICENGAQQENLLASIAGIPSDHTKASESPETTSISSWNPFRLATPGSGPTLIGKIYSVFNTALTLIKPNMEVNVQCDSATKLYLTRLTAIGKTLNSGILDWYLQSLEKGTPHYAINKYYAGPDCEITNSTLDEVKAFFAERKDTIRSKIEKGEPVVIPVVFKGGEYLGVNHIAVIMIKDGYVEFYDSKGVLSNERQLAGNSGTLEEVLKYLNDTFLDGQGKIFENRFTHQWDINNCGVYVAHFVQDKLKNKTPMGVQQETRLESHELPAFRQEMYKAIVELNS